MTTNVFGARFVTSEEIARLSDRELHSKCQVCGSNIRKLQKEFACYLPEVERRRLHKKYGFHSIYEYAARLAGMNRETADAIMTVHRKLMDKPVLKELMAESGWGKLRVVAAVATPENQKFWAGKIKEMSKATLVTYVRELKRQEGGAGSVQGSDVSGGAQNVQGANGAQTGLFTDLENALKLGTGSGKPMTMSQKTALAFKLDSEAETMLRIFKQKLEKKTREPQDWNEVMKQLLKIAAEHEDCGKRLVPAKPAGRGVSELPVKPEARQVPRHIPARVRKQLREKFGGRCAFPVCKYPAEINHHTKRFALVQSHNPDSIRPLCKDYERLAHLGLIENEEQSPEKWRVGLEPDRSLPKFVVDRIVRKHRAPLQEGGRCGTYARGARTGGPYDIIGP